MLCSLLMNNYPYVGLTGKKSALPHKELASVTENLRIPAPVKNVADWY